MKCSPVATKLSLVLLATACVSGCIRDKVQDTDVCSKETLRFYPPGFGDEFMIECMQARGYEFDVSPASCVSQSRMVVQPTCYIPRSWPARLLDGISWRSKQN
jgi:hypothetical protein